MVFTEFEERDAFSDECELLEYGSMYAVMNMGTVFLVFLWYVLLFSFYPLVDFLKNDAIWAKRLHPKLVKKLFWREPIVLIQEAFLELSIVAGINMTIMHDWSNWNMVLTNVSTVIITTACLSLVLFTVAWIYPRDP